MTLSIQSSSLSMRSLSVISDILDTQIKSCQFLKTVLPWAISSVLNRRCIFDEKYLKHRQIHNVPYIGFKSEIPKNHCAHKLFKASGLFQRLILEKHLKEIFIVIEDKETESRLEEFVFLFKYLSTDERSSDDRYTPMGKQIAKFHMGINSIPDDIKYSEAKIRIQFSCRLNEGVPQSIIEKNFKTTKEKRLATPSHMVSSLKTDFHQLELFISEQTMPTPVLRETATTQTSHNTSTNLPDYLNAMSPSSEIPVFYSANSESGQMVVNSEKFVQYSELDNDLILKPIRFNTPKPQTAIIKNLQNKRKLAVGFEPINPLRKKCARGVNVESSSSTFCSDTT